MSWSRARHFALGHLWHHLGLSSAHSARVIHFQWDELRWPHLKQSSDSSASSGKINFCVFRVRVMISCNRDWEIYSSAIQVAACPLARCLLCRIYACIFIFISCRRPVRSEWERKERWAGAATVFISLCAHFSASFVWNVHRVFF